MVKAQWQKSVLVVEQITRTGDESEIMHLTLRWMLSSDGRTLAWDPNSNGKLSYVYDKQ